MPLTNPLSKPLVAFFICSFVLVTGAWGQGSIGLPTAENLPATPEPETPPVPVPYGKSAHGGAKPATGSRKAARVEAVEAPEPKFADEGGTNGLPATGLDTPVELIEQRYPNGKIMLEREVVQDSEGNYINHGDWRFWDQAGNLIAEGRCRDNQLHGRWRRIYNGNESKLFSEAPYNEFQPQFISETTFEDGMQHGVWTISDSEGRKVSEIEFADGHRHGFARWYFPSGKKMQEIPFRNGFADGDVRMWSSDGELINEETFQAGRKLVTKTEYYSPGVRKAEIRYLQPQLVLQANDDWWKAKLANFQVQGQLEKHGPATYWYPNGQKRMDVEYRHGQLDGNGTWWYNNGQRAAEGAFAQSKAAGSWTWWHANGQKSASGQYTEGAASGTWSWWFEDGRLKNRIGTTNAAATANAPEMNPVRDPGRNAMSAPEVFTR